MAVRDIIRWPDVKLASVCKQILVDENKRLFENDYETLTDLKDTLEAHPEAIGLAACQIGVLKRMFVTSFLGTIQVYINPIYTPFKQAKFRPVKEGCLSVVNRHGNIIWSWADRFDRINATYQTQVTSQSLELLPVRTISLRNLQAQVFQHETDHCDGRIIVTKLDKS